MSRHDKDYNSSVKLSAYADLMLDRIDTCISDKISKNVTRQHKKYIKNQLKKIDKYYKSVKCFWFKSHFHTLGL